MPIILFPSFLPILTVLAIITFYEDIVGLITSDEKWCSEQLAYRYAREPFTQNYNLNETSGFILKKDRACPGTYKYYQKEFIKRLEHYPGNEFVFQSYGDKKSDFIAAARFYARAIPSFMLTIYQFKSPTKAAAAER